MRKSLTITAIVIATIFSFFVGSSFAMPASLEETKIISPEPPPVPIKKPSLSLKMFFQKDGVYVLLEKSNLSKEGEDIFSSIVEKVNEAGYLPAPDFTKEKKYVVFGVANRLDYNGESSDKDNSPLIYWRGVKGGATTNIKEGMRIISDFIEFPGEIEK